MNISPSELTPIQLKIEIESQINIVLQNLKNNLLSQNEKEELLAFLRELNCGDVRKLNAEGIKYFVTGWLIHNFDKIEEY